LLKGGGGDILGISSSALDPIFPFWLCRPHHQNLAFEALYVTHAYYKRAQRACMIYNWITIKKGKSSEWKNGDELKHHQRTVYGGAVNSKGNINNFPFLLLLK